MHLSSYQRFLVLISAFVKHAEDASSVCVFFFRARVTIIGAVFVQKKKRIRERVERTKTTKNGGKDARERRGEGVTYNTWCNFTGFS